MQNSSFKTLYCNYFLLVILFFCKSPFLFKPLIMQNPVIIRLGSLFNGFVILPFWQRIVLVNFLRISNEILIVSYFSKWSPIRQSAIISHIFSKIQQLVPYTLSSKTFKTKVTSGEGWVGDGRLEITFLRALHQQNLHIFYLCGRL